MYKDGRRVLDKDHIKSFINGLMGHRVLDKGHIMARVKGRKGDPSVTSKALSYPVNLWSCCGPSPVWGYIQVYPKSVTRLSPAAFLSLGVRLREGLVKVLL